MCPVLLCSWQRVLPALQMYWSSMRVWILQDPGANIPFLSRDCQERGFAGGARVVCGTLELLSQGSDQSLCHPGADFTESQTSPKLCQGGKSVKCWAVSALLVFWGQ